MKILEIIFGRKKQALTARPLIAKPEMSLEEFRRLVGNLKPAKCGCFEGPAKSLLYRVTDRGVSYAHAVRLYNLARESISRKCRSREQCQNTFTENRKNWGRGPASSAVRWANNAIEDRKNEKDLEELAEVQSRAIDVLTRGYGENNLYNPLLPEDLDATLKSVIRAIEEKKYYASLTIMENVERLSDIIPKNMTYRIFGEAAVKEAQEKSVNAKQLVERLKPTLTTPAVKDIAANTVLSYDQKVQRINSLGILIGGKKGSNLMAWASHCYRRLDPTRASFSLGCKISDFFNEKTQSLRSKHFCLEYETEMKLEPVTKEVTAKIQELTSRLNYARQSGNNAFVGEVVASLERELRDYEAEHTRITHEMDKIKSEHKDEVKALTRSKEDLYSKLQTRTMTQEEYTNFIRDYRKNRRENRK